MWVSTFYFLCNLNGILQMLISEFIYIYLPISLAQMFVMSTFFHYKVVVLYLAVFKTNSIATLSSNPIYLILADFCWEIDQTHT